MTENGDFLAPFEKVVAGFHLKARFHNESGLISVLFGREFDLLTEYCYNCFIMRLAEECKSCLYNSQMGKVERTQTDKVKLEKFKRGVKNLCESAPKDYCSPLLMRDINRLHCKIFGTGIDYSREKTEFNAVLLAMEAALYSRVVASDDPLKEALKFSMAANYIDFARLGDLNADSVQVVLSAAERADVDGGVLSAFKDSLERAETLCFLHDNCGEIVLDKILIRVIKLLYPQISVTSVVRGAPIINDVTVEDARQVGLYDFAKVIDNGADVPGTYLKEISPAVIDLLRHSTVIISKGLGNLETLYGEGFEIYYAYTCKCEHISEQFGFPIWAAAFMREGTL